MLSEFFAVPRPVRVKRNGVVMADELERYVELAANKGGTDGRVLVLLDADDDCPAELAPSLLARGIVAHRNRDIAVVISTVSGRVSSARSAQAEPLSRHVDFSMR